jgi:hypothetical protein
MRFVQAAEELGYAPPEPAGIRLRSPLPRDRSGRVRFTGRPDELASDIEAYAEVGVEHLTMRFWTSALDASEAQIMDAMADFMARVGARFTDGRA